ncbi:uncharacterized protein LOC131246067 [Magnolia sinica]|uniref:uncharacterized protein LOC131246067 n=1 Tax=Magnolia sinica TaxID=86752 RepID=UPI00265A588C|nr:uncharacterized protein LOC131246067 [Magnolia sinica]
MNCFSSWIQSQGLVDLPLLGAKYTWSNGRRSPIQYRLDRFLVSPDWLEAFPSILQTTLPRTTSDHCPLLLIMVKDNWGPKLFRINSSWFCKEGFKEKISAWWSSFQVEGFAGHKLICKLRLLKLKIKEWFYEESRMKEAETEALHSELQQIDNSLNDTHIPNEVLSRRIQIIQALSIAALQEEASWKIKSKARWIAEGDKNTKYFHSIASMRARSKAIVSICDNGVWIDDKQAIADLAINHFERLLSAKSWDRPCLDNIQFSSL